jgi:hypothetical protein
MMSKLKMELEQELKSITSRTSANSRGHLDSSSINRLKQKQQQEINLKSQIKHLNEQMKGVFFLLMQCQIGLDNCNSMMAASESSTLKDSSSDKGSVQSQLEKPLISFDDDQDEREAAKTLTDSFQNETEPTGDLTSQKIPDNVDQSNSNNNSNTTTHNDVESLI